MRKKFCRIMTGIGSVMEIMPYADYSRFVPKMTARERMQRHWERTGLHLQRAFNRFTSEYEQYEQEKKN
ncbi:MAG TPA: hypothetical protein ENF37_01165 [Beggiatoa sp.]|jgi:phosphopentomutase|nr:hypothetical protein [Beggiatoa sp.]